jgi:hypothetical protein
MMSARWAAALIDPTTTSGSVALLLSPERSSDKPRAGEGASPGVGQCSLHAQGGGFAAAGGCARLAVLAGHRAERGHELVGDADRRSAQPGAISGDGVG